MKYKVASCYKYIEIGNPELLRDKIRSMCLSLGILGRILIGEEGINAAVSGTKQSVDKFKKELMGIPLFADMTFREQEYETNTYHKLVTRVRKEIVVLGAEVDMSKKGQHVEPAELEKWLNSKEDVVLLDARNGYEAKIGRFEGATVLPIENFRDLPKNVEKLKSIKDKKIVMYCTGGIRCEKASAFLRQQGFEKVYQLKGGIINYVNQFPNSHWKGGLFVFDDRKVSDVGKPISECEACHKPTSKYVNCYNLDCDKLFVCCENCQNNSKTCSEKCRKSERKRKNEKPMEVIGIVDNYYSKSGIAQIKLEKPLETGSKILFSGRTTNFEHEVKEMESHTENVITIPVSHRVRKNDKVMLSTI